MDKNNLFAQFDKEIDVEGLKADIKNAANNDFTYEEVPHGSYEVKVEQMELKASKKGKPMLSIWFRIVNDCKFKNSMIFMNQVIEQGFQVHIANDFLRQLTKDVEDAPEIEFKSYTQYGNLILDIFEAIDDNYEFALDYDENSKGFNTFEITDTYGLED